MAYLLPLHEPDLRNTLGALCHILRDIDVISAFTEVALLGATLRKALKTSIYSKIATLHLVVSPVLL